MIVRLFWGDGEVWWMIEDFDAFYKRFMKAYRKNRLLYVRCAGTDRYINTRMVKMFTSSLVL